MDRLDPDGKAVQVGAQEGVGVALALFFLAIPAGWILFVVVVAVVAW